MSIVIDYTCKDIEGNEWVSHEVVQLQTYPSGEHRVNTQPRNQVTNIRVRANFTASNMMHQCMQLVFVMDILSNNYPDVYKTLEIPYMPYSRQDRRCAEGDSDQLNIWLDMIDGYFSEIVTYDMHNPESLDRVNPGSDFRNIPQLSLIKSWPIIDRRIYGAKLEGCVLVAPDDGARWKSLEVADHYKLDSTWATKKRDPKTGEITGTSVVALGMVKGKQVIICDDICDGGRTFIELAKVLKEHGATRVVLYVTHGILSKGCQVLTEWIDEVYIYNYIGNGPLGPNVWARSKD